MQTWASQEAYDSYLTECRARQTVSERDRIDARQRCAHGVSVMRQCKTCGIPEWYPDFLLRLWAAQAGPGIAEECRCGVTTRSDYEWDLHVAEMPLVLAHKPRA